MVEVLHLAAVLPATVGLCCAVGDRRGGARSVVPAAVMLLAMLAMAAGWTAVPPLAWAAAFVVLGIAAAAGLRRNAHGETPQHVRDMHLQRALGLVLGAALLVATGAHQAGAVTSGHPGHSGGTLIIATLAGTTGYLAFTAWVVARAVRRRAPLVGAVESSAMGVMTALMAVVPFVA